jgi:hypothetical protein
MSYVKEFATIDLLLSSTHETRGVDAFALTLIKAERQMRRLVSYLVYQFPCFQQSEVDQLREVLQKNPCVYFAGLKTGFDEIYPRSVEQLIGYKYKKLNLRLIEAGRYRNKIFHGQLTSDYLSRHELVGFVCDIREWCKTLAEAAHKELQYNGFDRNSFRKSKNSDLYKQFKVKFVDVNSYKEFIKKSMENPKKARAGTAHTQTAPCPP